MKNLWNKIPAWLKAVILSIIILLPAVLVVQTPLALNLEIFPEIPWAFPLALVSLFIFWKLIKHFDKFSHKEDVKLKITFDWRNWRNWSYVFGIFFFTPAIIQLGAYAFDIESTGQLEYIQLFAQTGPFTAIPLLLGLALGAGILEEVVYRGYVQNTLVARYPKWISFVFIAIIFAVMHQLPITLILPYMLASIAFSFVADQTKSTGVVIFAHILVDFVSFLLLYFEPFNLLEATSVNISAMGILLVLALILLISPHFRRTKLNKIELKMS